jgi:hypothetical protein
MRFWDLARAANAEKAGFWADIAGLFFIFGFGGGARTECFSSTARCSAKVVDEVWRSSLLVRR